MVENDSLSWYKNQEKEIETKIEAFKFSLVFIPACLLIIVLVMVCVF